MEPCSTTYQIRGRQARSAAGNNDDAGGGGVGARPVVSALAVPDDPLDGIMQCLGAGSGFAVGADDCWSTGAWFDEFRGGSMDMSTHAGVDFLEMPLELPDTTSVLAAKGSTETATATTTTRAGAAVEGAMEMATTRAEAVPLPDRPAVTMNLSPSFSLSDEDDAPWMSSSDSPSEDDDADDHWLPCESKKSGGTKRRLQQHQQQSVAGGQRKHQPETVVPPAPGSVVVAVEGGGGADNSYRCYLCDTSTTPLWRSGPDGPKTLCNRCGLQYSKLRAPTTRKRLPAAKPNSGSAKSDNYPVMPLAGGATVVRKKRSAALRID